LGVPPTRILISFAPFLLLVLHLNAGADLTGDELKMVQDSGGWEYIAVNDPDNGIQTKHTCFDGQPHPEQCSGTLTLNADNTFVQEVHIHGGTVERHGQYELDGNEITLIDELGTRDGPYTLDINLKSKQMNMQITQNSGVLVRIELELEKEYKRQLQSQKH
jgi:autotransporter-associated beta strand protein